MSTVRGEARRMDEDAQPAPAPATPTISLAELVAAQQRAEAAIVAGMSAAMFASDKMAGEPSLTPAEYEALARRILAANSAANQLVAHLTGQ